MTKHRCAKVTTLAICAFMLGSLARSVQAQDRPAVFVHGFKSDGSVWAMTAQNMTNRMQLTALTPSTPWHASFDTQSATLRDALNVWGQSQVIGIAHSNGGLNSRYYAQANGSASRINSLLTVGTPHLGTPFASNVLNGTVSSYFANAGGALFYALSYSFNNDPDWRAGSVVSATLSSTLNSWANLFTVIGDNGFFAGLGFGAALPVIQNDVPGSAFLGALNGGTGLSAEANTLTRRFGISTQLSPDGAFWALFTSDAATGRRANAGIAGVALLLYFHYANHPDYVLAAGADQWLLVYHYFAGLDVAWQRMIGGLSAWQQYLIQSAPSDGFILNSSSQYPNAEFQLVILNSENNIAHTKQNSSDAVRRRLEGILFNQLGVPFRPGIGQPPHRRQSAFRRAPSLSAD